MTKNPKRKIIFTTLILTILLIFSAYAALIPNVHAAEPDVQAKTLDVLNNVVGLNTTAYTSILNSQLDNQYLSLPQKGTDINLVSNQNSLRVSSSFVKIV